MCQQVAPVHGDINRDDPCYFRRVYKVKKEVNRINRDALLYFTNLFSYP
jgi:hypothetical protein